jgi:hypothetical protein
LWVLVRGSGQSRGEIKGPSCPYRPRGDPTTDRDDGPGRDRQAARCCAQHRLSVARAGRMTGIGARRILGAANPPIRLYCWSRDLSRWPSASSPCWAAGAHNAQPCRPLLHHMLPHGFSHRTGSTNKLLRHAQRGGLTSQSPIRAAHSEHMTTACIQAASAGPGKYPMRAATRSTSAARSAAQGSMRGRDRRPCHADRVQRLTHRRVSGRGFGAVRLASAGVWDETRVDVRCRQNTDYADPADGADD